MRWKLDKRTHKENTIRVTKKFAWFPVMCDTPDHIPTKVWLEEYTEISQYIVYYTKGVPAGYWSVRYSIDSTDPEFPFTKQCFPFTKQCIERILNGDAYTYYRHEEIQELIPSGYVLMPNPQYDNFGYKKWKLV